MAELIPTYDATIMAEECGPAHTVYRNIEGRRWVVQGTCTRTGPCMEGAAEPVPSDVLFPLVPWMRPCCPVVFIELAPCAPGSF